MIKYVKLLIILLLISSTTFSQTLDIGKVVFGSNPVHVPVTINGGTLNNVKSISLQIQYDPASMSFKHTATSALSGISGLALSPSSNFSVAESNGLISISWFNSTGVSLSGILFNLDFDYNSSFSEIRFTYATIKNMAGAKLSINLENGCVAENTNPQVKVRYPNGGEILEVIGTPTTIQWTSVYVDNVTIQYTSDNGSNWNDIINNCDAALNSYVWTIPTGLNSDECKIKIIDADVDPSTAANDVSDNKFTINSTPVLTVLSPNGSEKLVTGGVKNIRWTSKNVQNIDLAYTINSSAGTPTWISIETNLPANIGTYEWIIPSTTSTDCKIKIKDHSSTAEDLSNNLFSISNPPVSVAVPNIVQANLVKIGKLLGFYWYSPEVYKDNPPVFGWHSTMDFTYEVDGKTHIVPDTLVVDGHVPINIGSWITNLTYFEMEISFNPNVLQFDSLSNVFQAMKPISASVSGSIIHIIWSGGEPIDLYDNIFNLCFTYKNLKAPDQWTDFTDWGSVSHDDPATHHIQLDPRNYSDIKVKTFIAKNSKNDIINTNSWTDGSLSVNNLPFVKILYPIGGETLEYNDGTTNIIWVSRGVTNVNLTYTANGSDWTTINASTPSNGSFTWTIPNINSSHCKIGILGDAGSPLAYDDSPHEFSITKDVAIDLKSPDSGDILKVGKQKIITWASRNINNVKLEYTIGYNPSDPSSVHWNVIESSVNAKDYAYTWTVPDSSSTNCRVRISNASDGSVFDLSSGNFEINNSNVQVSLPTMTSAPLGNIIVPVTVDKVNSVTYINLSIKYNLSNLTLDYVESSAALSGGYLGYSRDNDVVRIVWISADPIDAAGTLFSIHFKNFNGVSTPLTFDTPNVIKDLNNNIIPIDLVNGLTDIETQSIPKTYALYQNYPNPFNPSTVIRFELPKSSKVNLTIYNILGQKIITLMDEFKNPGRYEIKWNASYIANGIYFYSIRAGDFTLTKKMILLK